MAKSQEGIEAGEYQTAGVNDDVSEPKQRGGEGSAKSNIFAHPRTELAHKKPMTER